VFYHSQLHLYSFNIIPSPLQLASTMSFLGMVMEVAGILSTVVGVATIKGVGDYNGAFTAVKIVVGQGDGSMGGNIPHIALWDDNGKRIGQYHAGKKHTKDEDGFDDIVIQHSQTTPFT
jgi:hypothetical protein